MRVIDLLEFLQTVPLEAEVVMAPINLFPRTPYWAYSVGGAVSIKAGVHIGEEKYLQLCPEKYRGGAMGDKRVDAVVLVKSVIGENNNG